MGIPHSGPRRPVSVRSLPNCTRSTSMKRRMGNSSVSLALAASLFLCRAAYADPESGEKVYQRTLRGTVWILARHGERMASGTGSLIDKTHRLVITNAHVVGEAQRVSVI